MTQDFAHLSSLLRRLHDQWWGEMLAKQFNAAAFTANDIESVGRTIAAVTHKLNEAQLASSKALHIGHPGAPVPPEKGD